MYCIIITFRWHNSFYVRCPDPPLHVRGWHARLVLTTAARLCPHLDHSYVTAAIEATQVYNYCCRNCPTMTERSKFLFWTSLFSVVGRSLAALMGSCCYRVRELVNHY